MSDFNLSTGAWEHGAEIPAKFSFGKPGADGPFDFGGNVSPPLEWHNAPKETKSFALIVHDSDVPSSGEDVNQTGKTVPANLPRVDFYHWVLVNIPSTLSSLPEGAGSHEITAKGKATGDTEYGFAGKNDYTDWFSGDPDMGGVYGNYDGPCPPWNDSIIHHYHFTLYALDTKYVETKSDLGGAEALETIKEHIIASTSYLGTYSMNPEVKA